MKVFFTGATGLLGANTVPQLLQQGHIVTAMVRNIEKATTILGEHENLKFVVGDLENLGSVDLSGQDAVVHAAALFTEHYKTGSTWEEFKRINVDGTVALFIAAKKAGCKKAIFISSNGALADPDDKLWNEDEVKDLYRKSKVVGEKALAAEPELRGFPVITLRPGWILGPNDPAPTVAGRLCSDLITRKRLELTFGEEISLVDARDVGLAIGLALEKADTTASFNIVGHHLPALEFFRMLSRDLPGTKVVAFPLSLALFPAYLLEIRTRLTGATNPMPPDGLRFLAKRLFVNNKKSLEGLGMKYRPIEETARDMAYYWKQRVGG